MHAHEKLVCFTEALFTHPLLTATVLAEMVPNNYSSCKALPLITPYCTSAREVTVPAELLLCMAPSPFLLNLIDLLKICYYNSVNFFFLKRVRDCSQGKQCI